MFSIRSKPKPKVKINYYDDGIHGKGQTNTWGEAESGEFKDVIFGPKASQIDPNATNLGTFKVSLANF